MTRRDFVVRAGTALAGASMLGLRGSSAWAAPRFPAAGEFGAEVPAAWFDRLLELIEKTPGFSPPVASRALAYAGLTLYEALVPGMEGYRSLSGILPWLGPLPAAGRNRAYDWPRVANAALAAALRGLFPSSQRPFIDPLEARLGASLGSRLPPGVVARSLERGREVAGAVLASARTDGGHEGYLRNFPPFTLPQGPGLWVPTPPAFQPALQPFWGNNRCMALAGGADCPAGDHPSYSEEPASPFFAEALEVYETVEKLTEEQEEIARFWSDDPGQTPTPPGHSIAIATQVLRREGSSLATAAETYAKIGIAVCDAFIACWYQKYLYNLLRPVTYIRTLVDPDWLPPLVTPPFPEYPSGHSVQSGAAFQVLTDLFGAEYAFVDHTHDERGLAPRAFGSFLEAAAEAAISRLYGGIHFRSAIVNGLTQGTCIGHVVNALPFRG